MSPLISIKDLTLDITNWKGRPLTVLPYLVMVEDLYKYIITNEESTSLMMQTIPTEPSASTAQVAALTTLQMNETFLTVYRLLTDLGLSPECVYLHDPESPTGFKTIAIGTLENFNWINILLRDTERLKTLMKENAIWLSPKGKQLVLIPYATPKELAVEENPGSEDQTEATSIVC